MLEDTIVRLRVLSPARDNPISTPAQATISDTAVEFANTNAYDLTGDAYRVTTASLDIDGSRLSYSVVANYSGTFTSVDPDTGFNGYELRFSELRNNDDMYLREARVLKDGNTLGLTQARVDITHSKLFVNIAGLEFDPDDAFRIELGFRIKGDDGRDTLTGGDGRDLITGGGKADRIMGEGGSDRIVGGKGADKLIGGAGEDRFVFKDVADSTVRSSGRDTILDFKHNRDKIDLAGIDANEDRNGNQKFHFISDEAFSKEAGELRATIQKGATYVRGDTDGDGKADFSIKLADDHHLVKADFLL